jgi:phosphoesterase RecJ-like protein
MHDIVAFIHSHSDFAITCHSRPDGDAIGSELALALALEAVGKRAEIINADPHPPCYDRLPSIERIHRAKQLDRAYDAVFVLETSDLDRTGLTNLAGRFLINIDHHRNTPPFGSLNWVDDQAAAVAELIYHLVRAVGAPVTPEIAACLYVAILTDTGSFQFANTREQTFAVARDLVVAGADPAVLARLVYMSQPRAKLDLLAKVLATLEIHPNQAIAWVVLTQEMMHDAGAVATDTEGMVNYPMSLEGVMAVAFFREEEDGRYRVSLRSKNHLDVSAVAEYFGGGGHVNAAGLTIEGLFPEVRDRVIRQLELLLAG